MKTIEQRVRDWQEVVAKIDDAPDQRYHAGRLAGISESLSIAQRYTRELEELHGVDGCSTGDCPHDNVNDCVKSQAEDIAQQAKHIATLTARLAEAERERDRLRSVIRLAIDELRRGVTPHAAIANDLQSCPALASPVKTETQAKETTL